MYVTKQRGTVTVPPKLRGIGQIVSWGKQVNRALQQLRDRAVVVPTSPRSTGGGGDKRFKITLNKAEQKIMIAPGMVVGNPKAISVDDSGSSYIMDPTEPRVDGVKITEATGISIVPLATGKTYGVYCVANDSAANIRIKEKETYKPTEGQTAFLIGTFKLKAEGGIKVFDGKVNQKWFSDITLLDEDVQNDSDSGFNSTESDDVSDLGSSDEASIIEDDSGSGSSDEESEDVGECSVLADLDLDPNRLNSCYAFPDNPFAGSSGTSQQELPVRFRYKLHADNLCVCAGWKAKVTIFGAKPAAGQPGIVSGESLIVDMVCTADGEIRYKPVDFLFYNTDPCAVHQWQVEMMSQAQPPPGPLDPPGRSACCGKTYVINSGSGGHRPMKLPRRCGSSYCSSPGNLDEGDSE
ncbi:hypothetical protein JIN84_05160 [Luteolibacter yonseiensis]|uniref:Uncharacterized protein n=1 Tax=Luteolibacter yonseiensis TaxID=1144680 RepID=A0A934R1F4_9BACT|nr:hypothetical protein [Luteolibacter yonseiensis]MBK1814992.1 hypothetical protein [Luteolibacter yonseiensis]